MLKVFKKFMDRLNSQLFTVLVLKLYRDDSFGHERLWLLMKVDNLYFFVYMLRQNLNDKFLVEIRFLCVGRTAADHDTSRPLFIFKYNSLDCLLCLLDRFNRGD